MYRVVISLLCSLVLQELGHVGSAQVNGTKMLEELLLCQVENTIVSHDWVEKFLDLWVAIPARTVVIKVAVFNFSTAPRVSATQNVFVRRTKSALLDGIYHTKRGYVPHFEQANVGSGHIFVSTNDRIGVVVHHAIGAMLV